MFTGIIEAMGIITHIEDRGTNRTFKVKSPISSQLKVDQSLSHNGVCLTVEAVNGDSHQVTAIDETLQKSNLGDYKPGDKINLERCILMNGRLDGHMVQGHVDSTGILIEEKEVDGSWLFSFSFPGKFAHLLIEKGSVCINGISLTAFNVKNDSLQVAIIPYTYLHTTLHTIKVGSRVNIEFDIIGKYLSRWKELDHK